MINKIDKPLARLMKKKNINHKGTNEQHWERREPSLQIIKDNKGKMLWSTLCHKFDNLGVMETFLKNTNY